MKIVQFIKGDFIGVHDGLERMLNRKIPKWVAAIWYLLMLPFGLIALPFVKLWFYFKMKQLERIF